jgi:hypothetical protein
VPKDSLTTNLSAGKTYRPDLPQSKRGQGDSPARAKRCFFGRMVYHLVGSSRKEEAEVPKTEADLSMGKGLFWNRERLGGRKETGKLSKFDEFRKIFQDDTKYGNDVVVLNHEYKLEVISSSKHSARKHQIPYENKIVRGKLLFEFRLTGVPLKENIKAKHFIEKINNPLCISDIDEVFSNKDCDVDSLGDDEVQVFQPKKALKSIKKQKNKEKKFQLPMNSRGADSNRLEPHLVNYFKTRENVTGGALAELDRM